MPWCDLRLKLFLEHLSQEIKTLNMEAFPIWVVGYSGGVDSHTLLHALVQLGYCHRLKAVYVNHRLHADTDLWQEHCQHQAALLKVSFEAYAVDGLKVGQSNLEAEARSLRYQVLHRAIPEQGILLTAHHQTDQAETFLLRLLRGAGLKGLCAMDTYSKRGDFTVVRPMLVFSKQQMVSYAHFHKLHWVEDNSNANDLFARNFIRNKVIPSLKIHWPRSDQILARSAKQCRQAQEMLDCYLQKDLVTVLDPATQTLVASRLRQFDSKRVAFLIRYWCQQRNILMPGEKLLDTLVLQIFESKTCSLSVKWGGSSIRQYRDHLYLSVAPDHKSCSLQGIIEEYQPKWKHMPGLRLKYRQGGERIRIGAMHKSLKKLFQAWGVPPWRRPYVPIIYAQDEIIAVVPYWFKQDFCNE